MNGKCALINVSEMRMLSKFSTFNKIIYHFSAWFMELSNSFSANSDKETARSLEYQATEEDRCTLIGNVCAHTVRAPV